MTYSIALPIATEDLEAIDDTLQFVVFYVAAVETVYGREFQPARCARLESKVNLASLSTRRLARHVAALKAAYETAVDASNAARQKYSDWAQPITERPGNLTEDEEDERIVHRVLLARTDRHLIRASRALFAACTYYLSRYLYKPVSRERGFIEFPDGDQIRVRRAVHKLLTVIHAFEAGAITMNGVRDMVVGARNGPLAPAVTCIDAAGGGNHDAED